MRILVVEDERALCETIVRSLRRLAYSVDPCYDGDTAIDLDDDMVLLARDISKKIEESLEYPGQIKVNVIRESRVTDYAK